MSATKDSRPISTLAGALAAYGWGPRFVTQVTEALAEAGLKIVPVDALVICRYCMRKLRFCEDQPCDERARGENQP